MDYNQLLRQKMEQDSDKYDFRVIKGKMNFDVTQDRAYQSSEEIRQFLRQPQIQHSADKLLNYYHSHQFSFGRDELYDVFRRVARAIPMDNQFGGPEFASTNRYKFRARNDPRFTDRRMQSLLNAITKQLDLFDLNMLADLLYSTVKLRLPEDAIIN